MGRGAWQQQAGATWPETIATGSLGWQRGAFGMNLMTVFAGASRHASSYATQDLQLSCRIKETELALGGENIFDRKPPHTKQQFGCPDGSYDPAGAVWYARLTHHLGSNGS